MLKLKMMLCVMMLAAGRRRLHIKAVRQSVRKATITPGDNAASPTGRHRWTGFISPSERGQITMQKQLEAAYKYINGKIELPISMGNHAIIVSNTHALPAEYKCSKVINRLTHLRMFAGLPVLTTFRATNFGCIDSFLAQFQKRRNDGWWFSVLLLPVCFEQ